MTLPIGPSQERELPAAQTLAAVEKGRSAHTVHLPARFARAALERLLVMHHARGEVVEGPDDGSRLGTVLGADEWALRVSPEYGAPLKLVSPPRWCGGDRVHVFPKHRVVGAPADAARLLRALEDVKPDERDEHGRPLPWVPVRPRIEVFGGQAERADDEADAVSVADRDALPSRGASGLDVLDGDLMRALAALAATAGVAVPELVVRRAAEHRYGFVSGRVYLDAAFAPLRIELVRCPNGDLAEALATLTHELAHATGRTRIHDLGFKRALVELATRHFGAKWFVGALAHLERSYRVVDGWIASGIRAALKDGDVPAPRTQVFPLRRQGGGGGGERLRSEQEVPDDGQLARVLSRIKKLRDLAADQVGRPEGIAAAAAARDQITVHGLEGYGVLLGEVDDQMVDMWVPLAEGVWRRTLAHAVARYCEVFSLAVASQGRMHFFGRHADIIGAEYLFSVSAARIARECDEHLARWKHGKTGGAGQTRRERYSFCDSAAVAFQAKLERIAYEEGHRSGRMLADAEAFADGEHEKRGKSWGSGGRRAYRLNTAGFELGRSLEVLHGVDGPDGPPVGRLGRRLPKGLPHR